MFIDLTGRLVTWWEPVSDQTFKLCDVAGNEFVVTKVGTELVVRTRMKWEDD